MVKNLPADAEDVSSILGSINPWRRKWQPTPVFLPEKKSHGQGNPQAIVHGVLKESDMVEQLSKHAIYKRK